MSRRLALIIGNSRYDDSGLASLAAPNVDVRELGEALRSPDLGQFDEVVQLVDESSPTVRRAIAQLFHLKRRDDLLLLYFSGHGIRDDQGQLYLATRDTERNLLSATAVEASFVTSQMDHSASRRQVLILDCCHSGAFGAKSALGTSIGTASAFEGIGFGRVVLTATDATQYAWEGERVVGEAEPSLFTNYLVLGIQSGAADLNVDGEITIDELYEYTYDEIVNSTSKQVPGKWAFKQQGEIVIARNPRGARGTPLPRALIDKVESQVESLQLEAIRDLTVILRGQHRARSVAARAALEKIEASAARRVAEAARDTLTMYPARRAAGIPRDSATMEEDDRNESVATSRWSDVRRRHVSRPVAALVIASVLALGAVGVWKTVGRRGSVASISEPQHPVPPTAPTSGSGEPAAASGGGTASAEPKPGTSGTADDPAARGAGVPDASSPTSQAARGTAPPVAGSRPRATPPGSQNSSGRRRSSSASEPNYSPAPTPASPPAPAAKEPESAPPESARTRRDEDPTALDRQAVLSVLERYRDAYSRKDLEAIKEIYPRVDRNLYGKGFKDCATVELRFTGDRVPFFPTTDKAQVNTMSIYTCNPRSKVPPRSSAPVEDVFVFARTAGGWVIHDHYVPRGK